MPHLYRFRSMQSLLGEHQELERQEIYLAAPGQLNDPMEGFKDLFWQGDAVLWRNLLRHYVFCLAEVILQCFLISDDEADDLVIPVRQRTSELPTESYKATAAEVTGQFVNSPPVAALISHLAALRAPLRREGLLFHLSIVHLVGVRAVYDVFQRRGLVPPGAELALSKQDDAAIIATIEQIAKANSQLDPNSDPQELEAAFEAITHVTQQLQTELAYQQREVSNAKKKQFVLLRFPSAYLTEIADKLIQPRWYTACFSANCTDASMWGVYGSSHTGAALKFSVESLESASLMLDGPAGVTWNRDHGGSKVFRQSRAHKFYKIQYSERAPEVDFFRYLGQLPRPEIENNWMKDDLGAQSERLGSIFSDLEGWRREYLALVERSATTKMSDWRYEDEYRLLHIDSLGIVESNRTFRYELKALSGIVFGMGTKAEHKLKVMEIVKRKCKEEGRDKFDFLEVRYNRRTGKFDVLSTG